MAIYSIMIFFVVYFFIITEKMNKAAAALLGAFLMIIVGIVPQQLAFTKYIDFNTIFFLLGMMLLVGIMKDTGFFEYLAIKSVHISKGRPMIVMLLISVITAFFSAFLDNVTTVLLIMPVMLYVAKELNISVVPITIAVIFSSNIGGTATLIGDPPNIMIGSQTGLSFMDFTNNLAPVAIVILIATLAIFSLIFRKELGNAASRNIESMPDAGSVIKDKMLLVKSLVVLAFAIAGFMLHDRLNIESATISMFAAVTLIIIGKVDMQKAFDEIEWETIFFFIGLFIIVGGLEETHVIKGIAELMMKVTKGDPVITAVSILWLSAIVSAFLDNIPFTAAMIPVIKIAGEMSAMDIGPLWWALALGACLGGNGTSIGASANVVAIGMLEEDGHRLSFGRYFKVGFPVMLVSIAIATLYILIRYY